MSTATVADLLASVRRSRDEMAAFVAELVRIPTENPPGRRYPEALAAIADRLAALGFEARIDPVPGGDEDPAHPRLWLRAGLGGPGPTVVFHGHVDVVPAQDAAQFEPRIGADAISGRGSADMKGGIASMAWAMKLLREAGDGFRGRVELRIVPDEETGGRLGSRALSEAGLLPGSDDVAMLTAEPTEGVVWHASRGAITCRITVRGRGAHVGLAHRGTNAFEGALEVARAIQALAAEVAERRTGHPIEPDAARRSIVLLGGEVEGCSNFNVVPDRFSFTVDRRTNPEEDLDAERARLLDAVEAAAKARGVEVEVDVFQEARPSASALDGPAARALGGAIEAVRDAPARFELCPGILETRFYAQRGVPAFAYGPGRLSLSHGREEAVERSELERCTAVYALAARRILASDAAPVPGRRPGTS